MRFAVGTVGLLLLSAFISEGCGRNERMNLLYAQRCFSCHGGLGRGDGPVAALLPASLPDFRNTVERKTTAQIRNVIAGGRGLMPAFAPALRPGEINDMVKMVRFLSREGRKVSWWEKYDALVVAHCDIPWELVVGTEPDEKSPDLGVQN